MDDDEEEEVEIVSGTIPEPRSPANKKRAFSLGTMDIDLPEIDMSGIETRVPLFASTEGSERCSSPLEPFSAPSAYSSDDEDMREPSPGTRSGPLLTPALSHTHASSSNSSFISLPLMQPSPNFDGQSHGDSSPSLRHHTPAAHIPATASRSEKAIAALTLAMANGAAGLNDYDALLRLDGASSQDESGAGELWH